MPTEPGKLLRRGDSHPIISGQGSDRNSRNSPPVPDRHAICYSGRLDGCATGQSSRMCAESLPSYARAFHDADCYLLLGYYVERRYRHWLNFVPLPMSSHSILAIGQGRPMIRALLCMTISQDLDRAYSGKKQLLMERSLLGLTGRFERSPAPGQTIDN